MWSHKLDLNLMATEPHFLRSRIPPKSGLEQPWKVTKWRPTTAQVRSLESSIWGIGTIWAGENKQKQLKEIAYLHDIEQPEVVNYSCDVFVHDSSSRDSHADGVLVLGHSSESMRWEYLHEKYSMSVKRLTGRAVTERVWYLRRERGMGEACQSLDETR